MNKVTAGIYGNDRFSPVEVGGCLFWVRAQLISGLAEAGAVAQQNDLSGNGNNVLQATGAAQPSYRGAVVGNKAVVRYDGGDNLSGGDVIEPANITIIVVGRTTIAVSNNQSFVGKGLGGAYFSSYGIFYVASQIRFYKATNSTPNAEAFAASSIVPAINTFYIIAGRYDGVTIKCRVNGGNEGSRADATGIFYSAEAFRLGMLGDGSSLPLTGDIAEVAIFNDDLSDAVLSKIEQELSKYYGIALS